MLTLMFPTKQQPMMLQSHRAKNVEPEEEEEEEEEAPKKSGFFGFGAK